MSRLCYTKAMQLVMRWALVAIVMFALSLPYILFAQQNGGLPERIVPCEGVDCTCQDLITLSQNLLNGGIFLAVFISAMLFAYAGWLYVSNEAIGEQQRAKSIFSNVVIGLIVILSAWLIVNTLMGQLLKDDLSVTNICAKLGL